jgi:hypothetical protein
MLLDSQEVFSAAQAVTLQQDNASTNILDTGAAQDEGIGQSVYLTVKCSTTATSGGSATVQPVLQTATDAAFTTPIDVLIGTATAVASVTAGTELLKAKLPTGLKRYLRVVYRIGTAALTAGKFDAFLTNDVQAQQYGASGFSVS